MKKLMLITAVTLAAVSAHASKARLDALQNAPQLSDMRLAFDGKAEETVNYEAALVEFGGTSNTDPNAEGGFIRKMGDNALGFYLGKPSSTYAAASNRLTTALANGNTDEKAVLDSSINQNNPITVTFGSKVGGMAWGVGAFYDQTDNKALSETSNAESLTGKVTQNIMGVYGGVNNGTWDAQLRLGLEGNTKLDATTSTVAAVPAGAEVKGTSTMNMKASGGYHLDTMYFYGHYEDLEGNVKENGSKISSTTDTDLTVGVVNSHKKDGVEFFYGVAIKSLESKDTTAGTKTDSFLVPVLAGVEGEATSWLTLRAAISQDFPTISTVKVKGSSASTAAASTTTTAGAGIKWGKAEIDGVLGMGSSGQFGTDKNSNMFTNASITYNF
jgi:hypothetical protein